MKESVKYAGMSFLIFLAFAAGLFICLVVFPFMLIFSSFFMQPSHFHLWAWFLLLWYLSVPCFYVLYRCQKVLKLLSKSDEANYFLAAKNLKNCSFIIFTEVLIFFAANVVFAVIQSINPAIEVFSAFILFSVFVIFAGLVVSFYLNSWAGRVRSEALTMKKESSE